MTKENVKSIGLLILIIVIAMIAFTLNSGCDFAFDPADLSVERGIL